jgi:hypothetical protein
MSALPTYSNSCVIADDKHNFTRLGFKCELQCPQMPVVAVSFLCVDFYFAIFFGEKKKLGKIVDFFLVQNVFFLIKQKKFYFREIKRNSP